MRQHDLWPGLEAIVWLMPLGGEFSEFQHYGYLPQADAGIIILLGNRVESMGLNEREAVWPGTKETVASNLRRRSLPRSSIGTGLHRR